MAVADLAIIIHIDVILTAGVAEKRLHAFDINIFRAGNYVYKSRPHTIKKKTGDFLLCPSDSRR